MHVMIRQKLQGASSAAAKARKFVQARSTRQRHRPFLSLFLLLSPLSHQQLFVPFLNAQHATIFQSPFCTFCTVLSSIFRHPGSPDPCSLISRSLPQSHTTCPTAEDTAAAVAMADAAAATPTGTNTARREAERTTTTTTQANTHRTGRTILPLNTGLAPVAGFLEAPSFLLSLFAHPLLRADRVRRPRLLRLLL